MTDSPRRMTAVVPTLLTLLNLCLGWLAVIRAFEGRTADAAALVVMAGILDALDGFVARAVAADTDFGRELDSLADVVSFGVAPAMIAVSWGVGDLGRVGVAAAFLFTACGALRLARFNVLAPATDKRWFVGLPIPMAAGIPITVVLSHALMFGWNGHARSGGAAWGLAAVLVGAGLLMVSRLRYRAFKDVGVGKQWRMVIALVFVLVLAALVAVPEVALPVLAFGYGLHGLVLRVVRPAIASRSGAGSAEEDAP